MDTEKGIEKIANELAKLNLKIDKLIKIQKNSKEILINENSKEEIKIGSTGVYNDGGDEDEK